MNKQLYPYIFGLIMSIHIIAKADDTSAVAKLTCDCVRDADTHHIITNDIIMECSSKAMNSNPNFKSSFNAQLYLSQLQKYCADLLDDMKKSEASGALKRPPSLIDNSQP